MGGNEAKMHTGKMAGAGGGAGQPHAMNQMSRNPQMGGKHPQMGGGNRPRPTGGQQQPKKKQGKHER